MDTTTSDTDRAATLEAVRAARRRLAVLAWTLDSAVKIPIVNVRVGLEPLLGFVPVVGDVAGKVLSLYLVAEAWRLSVPGRDLARMIGNVVLDAVLGAVPVVGDVFDIFWRANRMNMQILDEHLTRVDPEIVLDPKDWTAADLARDQKPIEGR
jgi:hypothetical protein